MNINERELLRRRESWQSKYNRRRAFVLFLEVIANLFWISYGLYFYNIFDFIMWLLYLIIFILCFIPGLVFILYDFVISRSMSIAERMKNIDAETEDPEFTKTITKATQFLFCFLLLIVIPSFSLLNFIEAYQLSTFFIAIFTLAIATLVGACWKLNTSWTNDFDITHPPFRPEDEYQADA